jgi:uncharacterized protein
MQNITYLPLHGGRAPRWLFGRMVKLGGLICEAVIDEYGTDELLRRLSDSYWLQSLSNAIGYDWHSSGSTTVTIGALKEYLNYNSDIFIAGGKGKQGTSTPLQIAEATDYFSMPNESDKLANYSRVIAKIDAALVYDDISIYHHSFILSKSKKWTIVQQAMQPKTHNAIRFQVFSETINKSDITTETNSSLSSEMNEETLDLTFAKNRDVKDASINLVNENFNELKKAKVYSLPHRHQVMKADLSKRSIELLQHVSEMQPETYEEILKTKGIGRKTLKSLAIISSLVYNSDVYTRNPTLYSFNVGGKDGTPYKIDKKHYDETIKEMSTIIQNIKIDKKEENNALRRLSQTIIDISR